MPMTSCLLTTFMLASISAFSMGSCPSIDKVRDPAAQNHTQLGGLWYEFVMTPGYQGSTTHDCATWNLLFDTNASKQTGVNQF